MFFFPSIVFTVVNQQGFLKKRRKVLFARNGAMLSKGRDKACDPI